MIVSPINPQRLRRIPHQFSWVDHRLVRQGYLQRCDHRALSLYLFYLTVADANGMSYYADPRLMTNLTMTQNQLNAARQCLITQGLIAYVRPFVQVLSLGGSTTVHSQALQTSLKTSHQQHASPATQTPVSQEKTKAHLQKLQAQLRKTK